MKLNKFRPRHDRTIEKGQLVGVHWNSHQSCWSIVAFKSRKAVGLVIGYADDVTLENVTFHIDKAKQKSVREKGTKDRHAFLVGNLVDFNSKQLEKNIYYNPFKLDNFVDSETREYFPSCRKANMTSVNGKTQVTYI